MRHTLLALALAGALWAFFSSIWSASEPNEGCGLDPSGWCGPAPQIDEGCILDPNGGCRSQGS